MAIGQGGYTGKLEEIMDALEPQSDQGQFFKDYLDYKQADNPSYVSGSTDGNSRRVWDIADALTLAGGGRMAPEYRKARGFDSSYDVWNQYYSQDPLFLKSIIEGLADAGETIEEGVGQIPEFLSDMGKFWGEAWEGQSPLDAPLVSAVTGPVDTALALGSGALSGSVSGLEGIARGFSLDESGWPTWSVDEADEAIAHRAANFPAYHAQTAMGQGVSNLVGGAIEGWGEHVGQPAGRFVQSAAELAGVPEESAIKWGATTAGAVSAGPLAFPFLKTSRKPATGPMHKGGFNVAEMRKSLEDQLGAANDFQYISDAWKKIDPEAWRTALDDGTFGNKISQIQEVVSKDLRDVAFFVWDSYKKTGIPKHWQEGMFENSPWYKDRTWYGRKQGTKYEGKPWTLDTPTEAGAAGYFIRSGIHAPTFTRSSTGRMLPNWGRGHVENTPLTRRNILIERYRYGKKEQGEQARGTVVHEWEHALDDILYTRLAPEATSMQLGRTVQGMPLDYTGRARPVADVTKLGMGKLPMMSDLSPSLKKLSDNVLEAEWRSTIDYQKNRSERAEAKVFNDLIDLGIPKNVARKIAVKKRKKKARLPFTRKTHDIGQWGTRSPVELRARLVVVNDYLAMTPKVTAWDRLQRPTETRRMTVEDLWEDEMLPRQVMEVREIFDDLIAYDVMTRAEATALFKEVLADVRKPYTKLTTELKIGPGPGLLYGGEE